MTDFAKILRTVRKRQRLTQEEAAETFDIPLWTLRRIERGKRDLKFPEIERIARCCGMSVSEMLQLEKEEVFLPPPAPFEQKEHFEKVIAAQNEHIASLLEEIKNLYGVMKKLVSGGGGE